MKLENLRILVKGRVQGVCFRYYTHEKAISLNLKGYVKNLSDGSVDVHVCGKKQEIETLIEWLHIGPPMAEVGEVIVTANSEIILSKSFSIEY